MIEYQSLPTHDQDLDPRYELIATARNFYHQAWMMVTAGNLSIRLPVQSFSIEGFNKAKS